MAYDLENRLYDALVKQLLEIFVGIQNMYNYISLEFLDKTLSKTCFCIENFISVNNKLFKYSKNFYGNCIIEKML